MVASQRETSPFLNANFTTFLTSSAAENRGIDLKVEIRPSSADKGLQVVDFVSWGVFRKYEYGDPSYAQLISDRIVDESSFRGWEQGPGR